jgi:SAM-dependent methyltransferase
VFDAAEKTASYNRDFWIQEHPKFLKPHYRLEKCARLVNAIAGTRKRILLDLGCGPATLKGLLRPSVEYHGVDLAISEPAPYLVEADILQTPLTELGRQFDIVVAQGLFEYLGQSQNQKLREIAELLSADGTFIVTYTNFHHRRKHVYEAFSNVQPLADFKTDVRRWFRIDACFPGSHNWAHGQPTRAVNRALNMRLNLNIPLVSPVLAVDYFFVCSPR